MRSSSSGVGARSSSPIAAMRSAPCPTCSATLIAVPDSRSVSAYPAASLQSHVSCGAKIEVAAWSGPSSLTGKGEDPQFPVMIVVTPWVICVIAPGAAGSVKSAWECRSMKPGLRT